MRKPDAYVYLKNLVKRAYAPYSNFKVAAIIEDKYGHVVEGVNVENASYGLTCCAERNAVFSFISSGMEEPVNLFLYTETVEFTLPCGACRQVISEFSPQLKITVFNKEGDYEIYTVEQLLPKAFDKSNLQQ